MREFSKGEIIRKMFTLPNRLERKVITERAWLDRLDNSLMFLEKEILEKNDSKYEFFSKYVNLNPRKENGAHHFEPITAIILIAFLSLYEHPFVNQFGNQPDKKVAEDWFSNIEETINRLIEELYVDENGKHYSDKEFIRINILSVFAKLAGLEQYLSLSKKADEHANRVMTKIKSLLIEDKAILYKEKLEKYLNNIEREIEKAVKRYDTQEKNLFEIDMEIHSNKISQEKLLEFMKSHTDEKQ